MISIIICSRTPEISDSLKANISTTIGTTYEIITIDNSGNKYSISEAYNIGVEQSKYPLLCFMHDDIEYHTLNWGHNVTTHFADEQTGAIGIAGTPYAAYMPGSWWGTGLVNQFILPSDSDQPGVIQVSELVNNKNEVLLLDGVWMCIRRSLFEKISFDTVNYAGFHFYDVDTCMQINQLNYKLYSVFDILLRHFTIGRMDKSWCENALVFNNKWKNVLPASVIQLNRNEQRNAELKTLKEFAYNLIYNNYPHRAVYRLAISKLLGFKKIFHYKSPLYLAKYLYKWLVKYP
ncbi:glycosyltransferase [Mucilaginibacter sp. L3T2-6]|uniref:glycosyltransferase n=1 Tax=Mucilaginibacter sp. L3T2-6 TaxID=3062491 RepID=UPI002676E15E|nr:glycosyltransferase [Mucilaginibacter sp. L3T2-6]MDO3643054.1 glycosyltransferase [Mucilaginibacter sp. L3T2-6]MDV6215821.1 glycosyltransferase [Mucilaginibacter sp. L3T2-6]